MSPGYKSRDTKITEGGIFLNPGTLCQLGIIPYLFSCLKWNYVSIALFDQA